MRNPLNLYRSLIALNKRREEAFKQLEGFSNNEDTVITKETIRGLEMGKWNYLKEDNGRYKLIELTEDTAVFLTEMNVNGTFGIHKHDCIEMGEIIKGDLIDEMNDLKLGEGETFCYEPFQKHKPYCSMKSVYKVTFK